MIKVLVLHPPMYPVNYDFYNFLGKYVELTIYQVGEYPHDHKDWTAQSLSHKKKNFELKIIGKRTNSFKNQLLSLGFNEIRLLKPDIVLSIAFWIPSLYYGKLSKILNFKFVILTNAIEATENNFSYFRKIYRKIICKNTNFFISASELTTKYISSLSSNDNIFLSVQTIETTKWREEILSLDQKEKIREELNIPKDKIIFLGVGNFYYKKNWESAFRSISQIENIMFVLVGSGEDEEKYLDFIDKNLLKDKIKMVGRKEGAELKKYFKSSDAFILPSVMETFGFVVVEALASDLPVLCSRYAGASTLINDGYNGYVIDSKQDFSDNIKEMLSNLKFLKQNAYNSVKNLTLENRAKEFYDIFVKQLS